MIQLMGQFFTGEETVSLKSFKMTALPKGPRYFHVSEVITWLCLVLAMSLSCKICTDMHLLLSAFLLLATNVENLLKTSERIDLFYEMYV